MPNWDKVPVWQADAFMRGCGVTLDNLWRHRAYLRRALDPRLTANPLRYAQKRGESTKAPPPDELVAAAIGGARRGRGRRPA